MDDSARRFIPATRKEPMSVSSPARPAVSSPTGGLCLRVLGVAQLMVVLDATIVNIALPSAQHALHFSTDSRQWVVTAYALAFGSLLLLGGKLGDLFGRKWTLIGGLTGFAVASAIGGLAQSFETLVAARALQGAFGALLAPSALGLLTVTFQGSPDRPKAFGIFSAIAAGGASVGLLLGGVLTQAISWRWSLERQPRDRGADGDRGVAAATQRAPARPPLRSTSPGVALASGGLFALVYGFSNAETSSWSGPDHDRRTRGQRGAVDRLRRRRAARHASAVALAHRVGSSARRRRRDNRPGRYPPCSRSSYSSPSTCSRTSATPR